MIGIDTFSWQKLIRLSDEGWKDIIDHFIDTINIFTTTSGKKEFMYRFPDRIELLDRIIIFPHLHSEIFQEYLIKFDEADASLLEYSSSKGYRIITEDRPMLEEGMMRNQNIVQLLDFFYELYAKYEFFSMNEIIKLIKIFRKWRNIKERKSRYYLNLIHQTI